MRAEDSRAGAYHQRQSHLREEQHIMDANAEYGFGGVKRPSIRTPARMPAIKRYRTGLLLSYFNVFRVVLLPWLFGYTEPMAAGKACIRLA